jgi:hypothetical protein
MRQWSEVCGWAEQVFGIGGSEKIRGVRELSRNHNPGTVLLLKSPRRVLAINGIRPVCQQTSAGDVGIKWYHFSRGQMGVFYDISQWPRLFGGNDLRKMLNGIFDIIQKSSSLSSVFYRLNTVSVRPRCLLSWASKTNFSRVKACKISICIILIVLN